MLLGFMRGKYYDPLHLTICHPFHRIDHKLGKHDGYNKGYRDGVVFCAKVNIDLIRQMEKKRQEAAAYHKEQEETAKGSSTGEEKCTSK